MGIASCSVLTREICPPGPAEEPSMCPDIQSSLGWKLLQKHWVYRKWRNKIATNWLACASFKGASTVFWSWWLWRMSRYRKSQALWNYVSYIAESTVTENKDFVDSYRSGLFMSIPVLHRQMKNTRRRESLVQLCGLCDQLGFLLNQMETAFIAHQYLPPLRQGAQARVRGKIWWCQYCAAKLDFLKTGNSRFLFWSPFYNTFKKI